jgi:hypothetical protein
MRCCSECQSPTDALLCLRLLCVFLFVVQQFHFHITPQKSPSSPSLLLLLLLLL